MAIRVSFTILRRPFGRLRGSFAPKLLLAAIANLAGIIFVATAAPPLSYDRDIQPILSDKCYHCHGPDAESREAELRLDTPEGVLESVVIAGKPDESELVSRIFSDDESVRMPPPDSHVSLTDQQKELLRRWIAEGATFTQHWSFSPLPATVAVPAVADKTWPREPFDNFVLARLEAEKRAPTTQAEALRLLRRISLDLTGLPPTAGEIKSFKEAVASHGLDTALAKAADRLLASPAFGEHMATAWLDAARYADSYGYQSDQLNTQWPYRDWVVRAFNQNLPYDQFLTWQLAGDLLENPTRDQILATAFNRLHRMTNEGGSIAEEWLVENAADRVATFGTAILGLTIECSRCHDHKYDPITMRDYYSLMSFFNSIDENGLYDNAAKVPSPSLLLPTPEQEAQITAARDEVAKAEAAFTDAMEEGEARFDSWLAAKPSPSGRGQGEGASSNTNDQPTPGLVAQFTFDGPLDKIPNEAPGGTGEGSAGALKSVPGKHGNAVRFDGDHGASFPDQFKNDRWDAFTLDFWLRDNAQSAQPVVVLQRTFGTDVGYNGFDIMLTGGVLDVRLYRVWPGNAIGIRSKKPIARSDWQHLAVTYDGSSTAAGLHLYLNGQPLPVEITRDHMQKSATIATFGSGQLTLGERFRDRGFKDGEIDELRIYNRALAPLEISDLHDGQSLRVALEQSDANRDELRIYYFAAIDPAVRQSREKLQAARRKLVESEDPVHEVPVMAELPERRPTYILARGAYDAPKTDDNRIERAAFEHIFAPLAPDAPKNRLGLARWLTDPAHPLTSRVFVNRLWANFFGRGLVETPENFGRQGAAPTNPELFDWLARDFISHDWNIKRLCRSIVLSATYRQDSRCSKELHDRDPLNQLLARGPSRRLSAEQIRDLALAASNLLDPREGGPPVSPYQPGGDLWRESNTMSPAYQQSVGNDLHRRSLYSVWKRTAPLPNMLAFDATSREVCAVARGRTNTPLQALVLLNDIQFVEAARALAADVSQDSVQVVPRIQAAFLRLTGRPPDVRETDLLKEIYEEQLRLFTDEAEQQSAAFLKLGEAPADNRFPPAELAALAVTCQAILNLDATIYER